MITSVVGEYNWRPWEIGRLFLDNQDYYGLEYWHNEVLKIEREIKKAFKKQGQRT